MRAGFNWRIYRRQIARSIFLGNEDCVLGVD